MRILDRVLLGLLIVDGLIVGLLSVAFVYLRIDGVAVPAAAVGAGIGNCVLLWLAARQTDGPLRYGPLVAWLVVLVAAALSGPGGDVMLAVQGSMTLATLLLVVIGLGAPVALIWTRRLPEPE
ncbi:MULTISPECIES: facilitated glucose transporter [unclassified Gordonia (in: high G+C Gram-positive bacteria)]